MDRSIGVRDRDIALLQRGDHAAARCRCPPSSSWPAAWSRSRCPPAQVVVQQGDVGDRYFVIESGEVEVVGDGRVVATLGPGEGFGEIALLRRVRRTATVARHQRRSGCKALRSDQLPPGRAGLHARARARQAVVVDSMLDRFTPRDEPDPPPSER